MRRIVLYNNVKVGYIFEELSRKFSEMRKLSVKSTKATVITPSRQSAVKYRQASGIFAEEIYDSLRKA